MKLRFIILSLLLCSTSAFAETVQAGVRQFQGTYNGSNQSIVATPGLGFRLCIRSFVLTTEDTAADWQFFGRTGATNTAVTPNADYSANSGVITPIDDSCWFVIPENQAWVVTTNNPVDIFGTYKIITK